MNAVMDKLLRGQVHCPICTHTVPADVDVTGRRPKVAPGQRCTRCASKLDAAMVVFLQEAA